MGGLFGHAEDGDALSTEVDGFNKRADEYPLLSSCCSQSPACALSHPFTTLCLLTLNR